MFLQDITNNIIMYWKENRKNKQKSKRSGSAMILTMFIMAGMLVVAMSGSYIILIGIRAGGLQSQSTRAYFAAEAGMEDVLYQVRQQNLSHDTGDVSPEEVFIEGSLASPNTSYEVFFTDAQPSRVFMSVGEFQSAKRSVEVSF